MRTIRRKGGWSVNLLACVAALWAAAAVGALTPQQKQFLGNIETRLRQAQANLKAAEESAGPPDRKPSTSAARLALTRSGSASAQLKTVQDALVKLPADDPDVKKVADQVKQVEQSIAALEKRLGGDGAAMENPGVGSRLDPRQEKTLKDAQFYLNEMEGAAQTLDQILQKVKAAKEPDQVDHRLLADAMAIVEKAYGRKKLTDGYFAQLPKDGAGVARTSQQIDAAIAKVDAASKELTPVHQRLQKLIDPAAYPKLNDDMARVQGFGQMFSDPNVLSSNPERAAELVKQWAAAREEAAALAKTYAPLVQQQTDAGRRLEGILRFYEENAKAFDVRAAARRKELPQQIQAAIDQAAKAADAAVKDKKPLFFAGDVSQRLGNVQRLLTLYAALDPAGAPAAAKALDAAREQMKLKQDSLRDEIIAANDLPPDRYTGADKAALQERAIAAWKALQPEAQVIAARFVSQQWSRESMWRKQNSTWYWIDRSRLQVQLLVKHSDKLAVIRPINLWTDHADADKVTAFPLHASVKDELQPQDFVPLDKVK